MSGVLLGLGCGRGLWLITAEGALQDWLGIGRVTQGELWSIFLALAATIMQVCNCKTLQAALLHPEPSHASRHRVAPASSEPECGQS